MIMSSYLHCNICGVKLKSTSPLNLFSCKHVLCKSCSSKGQAGYCGFCKKRAKATQINHKEPESMRFFSTNPVMKMKEALNAEIFQFTQQLSYLSFGESLKEKYNQVKIDTANIEKNILLKQEELKKELIYIKKLRALIEKKKEFPNENCSFSLLDVSLQSGNSSVSSLSFLSSDSMEQTVSSGEKRDETRSNSSQLRKDTNKTGGHKTPETSLVQGPFSRKVPQGIRKDNLTNRSIFSQVSDRPGSSQAKR